MTAITRIRTRPLLILLAALSFLPACKSTQPNTSAPTAEAVAAPTPALTSAQREKNLASFDYVWLTIQKRHWDPNLNGIDWNAARDELRPKVETATTQTQARRAMQELLARLEESHFGIIPAQAYGEIAPPSSTSPSSTPASSAPATDSPSASQPSDAPPAADDEDQTSEPAERSDRGAIGVEVRVVDQHCLVTRVHDNSPAAAAGVRAGWLVTAIDGKPLDTAIDSIAESMNDSPYLEAILTGATQGRLAGPVGEAVAVDFLDANDTLVPLTLIRTEPVGVPAKFGHLPTFHVEFRSQRLPENVGYIALSAFFDPAKTMTAFGSAVQEFTDTRGIIIDLRGNPGGLGGMAMGMGGWFIDKPNLKLGSMITRDSTLNFVLNPRLKNYKGPLVILVDGLSMSTSEIFSGGLKDLGRAHIVGTRTPGAALPSVIEKLPNGDGFQYAFADYVSVGGERLEGRGVEPHITAPPDRRTLLQGEDPAINAAVQWILAQP